LHQAKRPKFKLEILIDTKLRGTVMLYRLFPRPEGVAKARH
jgi:hypothetical protein